jgi:hypothetical protein
LVVKVEVRKKVGEVKAAQVVMEDVVEVAVNLVEVGVNSVELVVD